jgi:hypothetical protein
MQNYTPGSPVPVTFMLQNEAGETLEPTSLRWRVLDEDDQALMDWTALTLPSPPEDQITLTVPASMTSLATGLVRGLRSVELEVATASATINLSEQILLTTASTLVAGVNSFCSYSRAVMTAEDFTEQTMAGWQRESRREERERALIEAHQAIMRMPLYVKPSRQNLQTFIDKEGFAEIDPTMLQALRRAQVLEASEILNADPTAMARRNGLLSMTVGESSQYFGTAKPFESAVMSRQALKVLSPWISYSVRIGRA